MPISAPPPSWASIKNKPNTMAGFGITDEKCRAWVNFNGTGTVAIRASNNVSSITDLGVGLYQINFATSMPSGNYAVSLGNSKDFTWANSGIAITTLSNTSASLQNVENGSSYDAVLICASVFA
jgi:hypothetical protein